MLDVKLASAYPKVCLISIINNFVSIFWFIFRFGLSLALRYRASKFIYSVSIYRLTDNFEFYKGIDSIMTELWQTDQWLYGISSSAGTLYKSRNTQRRLQIIWENLQICSTLLHYFITALFTEVFYIRYGLTDPSQVKNRNGSWFYKFPPPVLIEDWSSIRWNRKSKFRLILQHDSSFVCFVKLIWNFKLWLLFFLLVQPVQNDIMEAESTGL